MDELGMLVEQSIDYHSARNEYPQVYALACYRLDGSPLQVHAEGIEQGEGFQFWIVLQCVAQLACDHIGIARAELHQTRHWVLPQLEFEPQAVVFLEVDEIIEIESSHLLLKSHHPFGSTLIHLHLVVIHIALEEVERLAMFVLQLLVRARAASGKPVEIDEFPVVYTFIIVRYALT